MPAPGARRERRRRGGRAPAHGSSRPAVAWPPAGAAAIGEAGAPPTRRDALGQNGKTRSAWRPAGAAVIGEAGAADAEGRSRPARAWPTTPRRGHRWRSPRGGQASHAVGAPYPARRSGAQPAAFRPHGPRRRIGAAANRAAPAPQIGSDLRMGASCPCVAAAKGADPMEDQLFSSTATTSNGRSPRFSGR